MTSAEVACTNQHLSTQGPRTPPCRAPATLAAVTPERRELVPFEALVVVAVAFIPFGTLPVALPLLVVASLSLYLRGRTWSAVATFSLDRTLVGVAAGAIALTLAVFAGAPLLESFGTRAIVWTQFPVVRGSPSQAAVAIILVAVTSLSMELALRGWIVERVLELSPGGAALPVFIGALAEGLVTPGELPARIGAALFGAGLGWMYCASGRSIVAPALARITFQAGAVTLEAMQLVG